MNVSPSSERRANAWDVSFLNLTHSDEGLMLFSSLPPRQHHSFFRSKNSIMILQMCTMLGFGCLQQELFCSVHTLLYHVQLSFTQHFLFTLQHVNFTGLACRWIHPLSALHYLYIFLLLLFVQQPWSMSSLGIIIYFLVGCMRWNNSISIAFSWNLCVFYNLHV